MESNSARTSQTIETGTQELLCSLEDRVATITLNRPEKRNALSDNLTPALRATLLHLDTRSDVGCVLITGAGKAFCAGGDVSGMNSGPGNKAEPNTPKPSREDRIRELQIKQATLTLRLHELSKPTIAALPGAAAGAGLSIALACDMRIASDNAFVTTAFRNIGLSGDYGCSWFMTALVGPAIAKELFLTSRRVAAVECLQLGLVNRVVPFDELGREAHAMAKLVAEGPALAQRFMKENLNRALTQDLKTCLDLEADRLMRAQSSPDHAEAVRAFLDKRPPRFNTQV